MRVCVHATPGCCASRIRTEHVSASTVVLRTTCSSADRASGGNPYASGSLPKGVICATTGDAAARQWVLCGRTRGSSSCARQRLIYCSTWDDSRDATSRCSTNAERWCGSTRRVKRLCCATSRSCWRCKRVRRPSTVKYGIWLLCWTTSRSNDATRFIHAPSYGVGATRWLRLLCAACSRS